MYKWKSRPESTRQSQGGKNRAESYTYQLSKGKRRHLERKISANIGKEHDANIRIVG